MHFLSNSIQPRIGLKLIKKMYIYALLNYHLFEVPGTSLVTHCTLQGFQHQDS